MREIASEKDVFPKVFDIEETLQDQFGPAVEEPRGISTSALKDEAATGEGNVSH